MFAGAFACLLDSRLARRSTGGGPVEVGVSPPASDPPANRVALRPFSGCKKPVVSGQFPRRDDGLVNGLLTKSVKLNTLHWPNRLLVRGTHMKKQSRGFWTWLLGGGWDGGGSNG